MCCNLCQNQTETSECANCTSRNLSDLQVDYDAFKVIVNEFMENDTGVGTSNITFFNAFGQQIYPILP